jgi:hypothetical protein
MAGLPNIRRSEYDYPKVHHSGLIASACNKKPYNLGQRETTFKMKFGAISAFLAASLFTAVRGDGMFFIPSFQRQVHF